MTLRGRAAGAAAGLALALLAGCGSVPLAPEPEPPSAPPVARPDATPSRPTPPVARPPAPRPAPAPPVARGPRCGACYQDDGPGANPPPDLHLVPDAVPRAEPLHPAANRPYRVFGRQYVPRPELTEHRERGFASWYGRKFHGRQTSSGERYDMYAMTAAHPTLPIPSYARVTNVRNGRSVVVRVNDRGPFLNRRVIDLSYTAAIRLGYAEAGSAEVEVELLQPPVPAQRPIQTAVRSDVATAAAPGPVDAPETLPMLAEAAAERLAIETTVDARVVTGEEAAAPMVALATVAPPVPPPSAGDAVWLQFGAFASRDNAEAMRARVARDQPWLAVPIDVVPSGEGWRVQAGPWAHRDDARAAAERVGATGAPRPIVVVR